MAAEHEPATRAEVEAVARQLDVIAAALQLIAEARNGDALRLLRRRHLHPVGGEAS